MSNIYDRQLVNDGRILHHLGIMLERSERGLATPKPLPADVRCAWCDAEAGIKPDANMGQTHGICLRHHAQIKANLDALRRMAA